MGRNVYCQTVAGWLMCGALSDERTGLASEFIPGSESCGIHRHILRSQIRYSRNLADQEVGPVLLSRHWFHYIHLL
jgi:hypothetical protein